MTTPEPPENPEPQALPEVPPAPAPAAPSAAWAAPVPAGVAPGAGWSSPGAVVATPRQTVNGMAVASLVLGLCCWCFFVPGILAVIFGNLALGKIATSEGREKGRGMAIAGIVLGWISIAVLGGLAIAWLAYGIGNA